MDNAKVCDKLLLTTAEATAKLSIALGENDKESVAVLLDVITTLSSAYQRLKAYQ